MNTRKDTCPFKLNKLTLRGIGSYLGGVDIDIRPLTILCGTNGSGKSTWINTLSLLKAATTRLLSDSDEISFDAFLRLCEKEKTVTEEETGEIKQRCPYGTIANTRISQASEEDKVEGISSGGDEKIHGPIGSIGFHFLIDSDYQQTKSFSFPDNFPDSPLSIFLKKGLISKEAKIKVFLTIPDTSDKIEGLAQGFEIVLGNETLTYKKIPKRNPDYKSFNETPDVIDFLYDNQLKISCQNYDRKLDSEDKECLCYLNNSFLRVIELLKDLLSGFYHIGAIRDKFDKDEEEFYRKEFDSMTKERSVGFKGEYTHFLVNKYCWNFMGSEQGYRLGEYYSVWLQELLGHGTCYSGGNTLDGFDVVWDRSKIPCSPVDFLKQYDPDKAAIPAQKNIEDDPCENPTNYRRYNSDVLWGDGLPFGPSCFSSGFHQIAPMIVQSGLMKKSELVAIENPEVHLHPNLQLKLAEFLLKQANSGRYFIIETHSDLIIRRVIRAILEETVFQEKVRIYFTSIEQASECYSKIEPLKVDEQGRIDNWPAGFLDESLKESQRLMKIVYDLDIQDDTRKDDE